MSLADMLLKLSYKYIVPRMEYLYPFRGYMKNLLEGEVLDMGGGSGVLHSLIDKNIYYINLDIDYDLLNACNSDCEKVCASSNDNIFRDSSVDHVIIHEALHHFNDPIRSLLLAYKYVRKCIHIVDFDIDTAGGYLFKLFHDILMFKTKFYSVSNIIKIIKTVYPDTIIKVFRHHMIPSMYYLIICKR